MLIFSTLLLVSFQNCGQAFEAIEQAELASRSSTSLGSTTTKINQPAANSPSQGTFTLRGSCAPSFSVEVSGDIVPMASLPCVNGQFAAALVLSSGDGAKNVIVKQLDSQGNEVVDSRSFIKDTTPPNTDLVNIQNGAFVKGSVVVSGICETGLPVTVGAGTTMQTMSCQSGMFSGTLSLSSLGDGALSLQVSQTDLVGLTTSRQRNITKDTLAPQITITAPGTATPVVSPLALSGSCETGSDVVLSGTGVASSLTVACVSGAFSAPLNLLTGAGSRQVVATQTDAAGNAGSSTKTYQAQVPTVPPLPIAITAPAANTAAKDGVTISGTCQAGITVEISGAGVQTTTATCSGGSFSKAISFSAGDGAKLVTVKQTNSTTTATGTDSRSFMRDTVAPALTIAMPAANASAKTSLTLTGACETGLAVNFAGSGVAATSSVSCVSGAYTSLITLSAGDGAKQVTVTQTDAVGNGTTQTRSFTKDNTAPIITIVSPAANTSAATGLTITGACETGLNVVASGTGLMSPVTVSCLANAYSVDVVFSANDGSKSVDLSQTDAADNKSSVSRSFVRTTPVVIDGAPLYANNCAGCHGPLATSTKLGRTATQITNAIASVPLMNSNSNLRALSAAQIQAISKALDNSVMAPADSVYTKVSVRRLSRAEYDASVASLLGDTTNPARGGGVTEDAMAPYDNDPALQVSSAPLIEGYELMATDIANRLTADTVRRASVVSCQPASTTDQACLSQFIKKFTRLAFRRPVTDAEVQSYVAFALPFATSENSFYGAVNAHLRMVLQHPEFIFRIEGKGATGTSYKLNAYEIATRLSFFILGATPDASLLDSADKGELNTPAGVKTVATKMLSDARAVARFDRFHAMWLGFEKLPHASTLTNAMRAETQALMKKVIFDDNASWYNMLQANQTYIDDTMASYYGLTPSGQAGSHWISYGSSGRQGLLSQGSFLSVAGKFGDTSPTQRGKLIRMRLMCQTIPPPPPTVNVDSAPVSDDGSKCKYDRYASHRQSGTSCAACHQMMDPIGFGLENFDQFGKYRLTDNGLPNCTIAGLGELDGIGTFRGPAQLSDLLVSSQQIEGCLVQQVYHFALGVVPTSSDDVGNTKVLATSFRSKDHRLKDLILDLVSSNAFLGRISE